MHSHNFTFIYIIQYIFSDIKKMYTYRDSLEHNVQIQYHKTLRKLDVLYNFAIQSFPGKVWWICELVSTIRRQITQKHWIISNLLKQNWNPFCYNMHFLEWKNLCHTDYIRIGWVCKFDKLPYLSDLISSDILHYIILYCVVVMWIWCELSLRDI
jgi:hypothetical protein